MEKLNELDNNIKNYIDLKYKNNFGNIYYDPIILEILDKDELYNCYVKPIIKISKDEYFCKIISLIKHYPKLNENNKKLIENLINNTKKNYNSFYT